MRPMLAVKSLLSCPLLQAVVTAFQVSAGDGTITAPLEWADSSTHSRNTAASPPTARPTRHRIGSSDRIRRTGDCRRPRPPPFGSAAMGRLVGLGERRVVQPVQGGPRLDKARPQPEAVDLPE